MPAIEPVVTTVTIGVDTHKDLHVAVALDALGRRLAELSTPATAAGYQDLYRWAQTLGDIEAFGVEGTGSYGAGLARHLRRRGSRVIEVNRPDRSTRHRKGKSDPIDAEAAARSVLSGTATATPKNGDDQVEIIRMIKQPVTPLSRRRPRRSTSSKRSWSPPPRNYANHWRPWVRFGC